MQDYQIMTYHMQEKMRQAENQRLANSLKEANHNTPSGTSRVSILNRLKKLTISSQPAHAQHQPAS